MSIKGTAIRIAAALVAASASAIALAQAPAGAPPPRASSPELEALNPPVPADLVLSEERRVPAEKKAAAYNDRSWTAPKTSWGHPSLQGTWSTDDMRGIPFDRPEALGTQEFLSEQQFIERAKRQQAGSDHAANVQTFHRVAYGIARFRFLVARRRSPERPHAGADGRRTRASRRCRRQRLVRPGSVRHVRGFLAVRPLHRARLERRHERRALRQRHRDRAEPGQRHDHVRDGARDARDSARRPAASRGRRDAIQRQLARPLGRRHARRRDAAASRTKRASAPAHRTARACGRRSAFVASIRT